MSLEKTLDEFQPIFHFDRTTIPLPFLTDSALPEVLEQTAMPEAHAAGPAGYHPFAAVAHSFFPRAHLGRPSSPR
ncbi:MAG: hypothetical protein L3K14_01690 [Thermoplasmata archaeon]|nr:hypothetical protein [Thermoplasmata archaeon]